MLNTTGKNEQNDENKIVFYGYFSNLSLHLYPDANCLKFLKFLRISFSISFLLLKPVKLKFFLQKPEEKTLNNTKNFTAIYYSVLRR